MTAIKNAPEKAQDEVTPVTTVAVSTVPPTNVDFKLNHVISWSRRATAQNPVTPEQRYRGITVAASLLAVPSESCNSKFHALLQSTIHKLADSKFAAWAKDNMLAKEAELAAFSLDAVLTYWAEERQREVVDGDKLAAWLKTSKTLQAVEPTKQELWLKKLPKIAAPAYQGLFSKADALRILALIHDDETTSVEGMFIATRANNIIQRAENDEAM